ncbi:hypothetical protein CO112_01850 [Candidatus Dojkabacteria bacterium CG_4_9_14_3_um_filter_150_Dojkabacteria_WS6_41_13]|uniref:Aminoacyl-transfer RNA synthetases class-II family profile domain-containing protein n=1 Tax=Candidatus Dojkabacteria bacterium CG_4_10_14_0_2_um_filter_Dojkabacteria_WS6_41_15 TaxID=2014249 RepID=A0A2M7W0I2_9BACT|nr:MAG: hypothetical protein COZ14_00140 [Candidatus Dojkabacteria bacterium CG_4_10_14_3_um_filter_Dojkabacteria_WS6_41_9]PJA12073.1 MAG: hypothetical protein COX64_05165 [Candidatus Dojkabacteria bacterium CG_4_10_14_0_2_um_filter_Dojkabacteria_WS6_41_15]PJB22908.1 MAG: hypothetical protein CO112_01850 [Candidatus Dojkabacteria bacterium CG_4_9_14_3_um_filter_150_Dojkabacteria_WS6_41_13]
MNKTSFFQSLLANQQAKEHYLLKLKIISLIRQFFTEKGLLEVEAPILNDTLIPESYLDVFETEERRVGLEGKIASKKYLMTSPESFQKKLLSVGFGSNFALTRSFRNGEPLSGKHLSEFSMLEWYEKGSNYLDVMNTTEQLFSFIVRNLDKADERITYNGIEINLAGPWQRSSVNELFKEYLSIDLEESWDQEARGFSVKQFAQMLQNRPELHIKVERSTTWEELFNQLFLTYIETRLPTNKPVIIYDYPHELSPLAKPKSGVVVQGNVWAERFEVMIGGLEICDTYTENTDSKLQRETFNREIEKIEQGGAKTKYAYDWEFVEALEHGLPACSGNALGIDRVVMLFGNYPEILTI